nr:S53 family peptidase [Kitasatospora viridis]
MAIAGLGFGAQAASASTTATANAHHKVTFTRSCAVPQHAGYLACNALHVTGGNTVKTRLAHPARAARADLASPDASADATVSGYGPSDIQSAYNLASAASSNGAGETVAIVDAQDDPNAESDLAAYRSQFGLPECSSANGCFSKVDENGGTNYPSPDSGWAGEISLDLDMVSATCPNCNILLVEATSASTQDLGTAVNQAVSMGAKFVSNSYGGSESSDETSADSSYYNHPGVAITASAGDSAYGVEYPAASPYVTAVGGTSLTQDSSARGWSESVWGTSATEGTGSGCSAYEAKPSWQTDSGCSNRTVADVSAVADPATGVAVYDTYQASGWNVYGGTSASSPIIASVYALAGNPGANTTPAADLYANTSALNDVTTGSNGTCDPSYLCTAGPGYDGPTGLGTPNGTAAFSG